MASLKNAVEKRGSSTLAFVNSFGGKIPLRNMPAYTASKFALAGYVDSIRPELGDAGIRVVQIHPGSPSSGEARIEIRELRSSTCNQLPLHSMFGALIVHGQVHTLSTTNWISSSCTMHLVKEQGVEFKLSKPHLFCKYLLEGNHSWS